jgi:hypothetical protein
MSDLENIQAAEQQVATLQDQLDQVQQMLQKAEQVAAAGEAAKERAQQLLGVSIALIVLAGIMLLRGRRK